LGKLTILFYGKELATWEGNAQQVLDSVPEAAAVAGMTCEDFVEVSIRNFYELTRRGLHDEARYAFLWKILTTPWAKGTLADYVGGCDFRVDVSSDSGGVRVVLDA
jgi:hypothetical protein